MDILDIFVGIWVLMHVGLFYNARVKWSLWPSESKKRYWSFWHPDVHFDNCVLGRCLLGVRQKDGNKLIWRRQEEGRLL